MLDVLYDDRRLRFVAPLDHRSLGAEPGTVESGQGISQWLADAVRRIEKGTCHEFDSSGGNVLRKQLGDRAPGRTGQPELVGVGTQRLRSASSARTASVP